MPLFRGLLKPFSCFRNVLRHSTKIICHTCITHPYYVLSFRITSFRRLFQKFYTPFQIFFDATDAISINKT